MLHEFHCGAVVARLTLLSESQKRLLTNPFTATRIVVLVLLREGLGAECGSYTVAYSLACLDPHDPGRTRSTVHVAFVCSLNFARVPFSLLCLLSWACFG